jgi:class 3 adenylate cyclase/predicted ATPase
MDVVVWLRSLGLGKYEPAFRENDIDESVLPSLTHETLKDLGVTSVGHRLKLLEAIAALCSDSGGKTASINATTASSTSSVSPEDRAERRQVTVMFSDLVGSTALSARMDPEDLREVITAYQKSVTVTVQRFGGFVAKYMGDGVLIYFGYPQAHEDDAERAVRAGLELVAAAGAVKTHVPLQTRVGVATGLVVVGDLIGSGASQEQAIVGETPNLAARLQGIAIPNSVVISESTRKLVGNLFELQDLGEQDLKGITGSVRAWAALRPSSVESRFEALHAGELTELVGREEELELLVQRWSKAKTGQGQVVLLSGEPGIGKSRLTAALLERVAAAPHTRLRYFCSPQHTDSALYPIISQMERAAGFAHDDTAQAKLDKLDALLAQSFTSRQDAALFAETLSLPNDGRHPTLELPPQQRRQKTLEALAAQLQALSRSKPVLMIFEDLHWADPTSLEALGRVVEGLRTFAVLLIATYRPEFEPPWIGRSYVTALGLNRLGEPETFGLIDRLTGGKPLSTEIRREIIERTDGIPLFVEEMTKAILEAKSKSEAEQTAAKTTSPSVAVPASLHASLMARLDRLGPAKEIAQIGAVIGREFSHALLVTVARKEERNLQLALDGLMDAGLLFRVGAPPHATYLFKHALVRDASYGTLLREPRRTLHARIVASLENQFPEIAASQPHLMAQHCADASLHEKAISYWLKAGEQAVARSAMIEAETLLRKGLSLVSNLTDSKCRLDHELSLQIALGLALSQTQGFHSPAAREAYSCARQLCDELKRPQQLLPILYGQWISCLAAGQLDRAEQFAAEILTLGERADDVVTRVVGCRAMGGTSLFRGDFPVARINLERGLALYDPAQRAFYDNLTSVDTHVALLGYLAPTLICSGQLDRGRLLCDQAISKARGNSHAPTLAHILWMAWWAGWCARLAPQMLLPLADELVALTMERKLKFWHAMGTVSRGWCLVMLGHEEQGYSLLRGDAASELRATCFGPLVFTMLADASRTVGQPEVGLAHLVEAHQKAEVTSVRSCQSEMFRLQGLLLMLNGVHNAAEASFANAIALAQRQGAKLFELRASLDLARNWRDQGKVKQARELLVPICDWFTEGFDTGDLKEAKTLLEQLPV